MPFLFRMTFTGLCAFVPGPPLADGTIVQGTVLLPNANPPIDDLNFHSKIEPHVAYLHYQGGSMNIAGKMLSIIAPGATPDPLTLIEGLVQIPPPTYPTPPVPARGTDQDRDTFWITRMADLDIAGTYDPVAVDDNAFSIIPSPIPPPPSPRLNPLVTANIKVTAGYLSTSRMIEDQTGLPVEWDFKTSFAQENPTPLVRAMAAEFSVTMQVPGNYVTLQVVDGPAGTSSGIVLQPQGGEVLVRVENLCRGVDHKGKLQDFAWFYRIANEPFPIYLPYRRPGSGLTDTYCPPAQFPPHAQA